MHHKGVGAGGIGDGHHRAVAGTDRGHRRRNAILTIRAIVTGSTVGHHECGGIAVGIGDGVGVFQTIGAGLGNALDADTGSGGSAVQTVGHREGADAVVRIVDGVGVHIAITLRTRDRGDAATVVTIRATGAGRSDRALGAFCAVMQHKSVGTCGIGDGHHRAVAGTNSGHHGGESVVAIGAVGAVVTGRALRTVQDGERMGAVHIGDSHHGAVASTGGGHRGRNTVGAVLAVSTVISGRALRAIQDSERMGAVGIRDGYIRTCGVCGGGHNRRKTGSAGITCGTLCAVQDGESMGTVRIGDGHLRTRGSGGGGHRGRKTVVAVQTVITGRTLRAVFYDERMGTVGIHDSHHSARGVAGSGHRGGKTRLAGLAGSTILHIEGRNRVVAIHDGVLVCEACGDRSDDVDDAASGGAGSTVITRGAGSARSSVCTIVHHKGGLVAIGVIDRIGVVQAAGHRSGDGQDAATVDAVRSVQDINSVGAIGIGDG